MPIITCGGMRQQITWKPQETTTSNTNIPKDCEDNFQAIVDRWVTTTAAWKLHAIRVVQHATPNGS